MISAKDATAAIAQATAIDLGRANHVSIIQAPELPAGWSGKLWALQSGLDHIENTDKPPDYYWLSDADIYHDTETLCRLTAWAERHCAGLTYGFIELQDLLGKTYYSRFRIFLPNALPLRLRE